MLAKRIHQAFNGCIHFGRIIAVGIVPCVLDPMNGRSFLRFPCAVVALGRTCTILFAADQHIGAINLVGAIG